MFRRLSAIAFISARCNFASRHNLAVIHSEPANSSRHKKKPASHIRGTREGQTHPSPSVSQTPLAGPGGMPDFNAGGTSLDRSVSSMTPRSTCLISIVLPGKHRRALLKRPSRTNLARGAWADDTPLSGPGGIPDFHPGGMPENSPAFQRRDPAPDNLHPSRRDG